MVEARRTAENMVEAAGVFRSADDEAANQAARAVGDGHQRRLIAECEGGVGGLSVAGRALSA